MRTQSQLGEELKVYTNVPLSKYILPSTQWANTHLYHNWTLRPLGNIVPLENHNPSDYYNYYFIFC